MVSALFGALESQILEEPVPSIHGSERVVRLQVESPVFSLKLQNRAILALTRAGLVFVVFGIENVQSRKVSSLLEGPCPSPPSLLHWTKLREPWQNWATRYTKATFSRKTKLQCIPLNTCGPSKSSCQSWQTTINVRRLSSQISTS